MGPEIDSEKVERLRDLYEDAEQQWADFTQAQTEELAFAIDLDMYQDENGNQKDPNRLQPKVPTLFGLLRHKAGQISRSGIHLDVQPNDDMSAPELAELAESLIFKVLHDPMVRYADTRDRAALMGMAARMGAYRIEFDPSIGEFGDVVISHVDSRNLRWAAGYTSPHNPRCPWFYEVDRIHVDRVAEMDGWKNNKDLIGGDSNDVGGTPNSNVDSGQIQLGSTKGNSPGLRPSGVDKFVTVVYLYERHKRSSRSVEKPGSFKPLDTPDQFYSCMQPDQTGCGYQSSTIGEGYQPPAVTDQFGINQTPAGQMPQDVPGGCPHCQGDLMLNTSVVTEITQSGDNTLTIFAPYEDGGTIFYEGPWPHDTRSVPYFVWTGYIHPLKPMGQSDTSLNWTLALASNMSIRLGLEHMLRAKPYWYFPTKVEDAWGEPFLFGDNQGLGIYPGDSYTATPPMMLQASGLPPAWATLNGAIDNALRADLGTNDVTFGPDQSRDIAVGTMKIQEQLGEIPVAHQIERFQQEESIAFSIVHDIQRACYTDKRFVKTMGRDGIRAGMMMRGSDLPSHTITVTADPMSKMPQSDEIQKMVSIAQNPPYIRNFLARSFNIPRSLMTQLDEEEAQFQQQQAAQMAQQAAMQGAAMVPGKPGAAGAGSRQPSAAPQPQMQ